MTDIKKVTKEEYTQWLSDHKFPPMDAKMLEEMEAEGITFELRELDDKPGVYSPYINAENWNIQRKLVD